MTAIVTNSGQAGSVATNYIVFDEYPEGTMLTNGAAPVPALAPGDSITLPVSLTASTACGETHTLRLRVDALAWVDETDEADNYLLIHYDIRAPNVYPTSLSVPGHPACGSVTVSVHVSNNGNYQANSGLVKFTDTTAGVASYSKTVYASFPNVPPGTSRIVSQTFPMLSYCNRTHTLTALVDSAGTVPERNESDNSMQVLYHPDL